LKKSRLSKLNSKLETENKLETSLEKIFPDRCITRLVRSPKILYVMQFLGHKNIKNTLLYIQLAEVIFKEASDQFTSRVAKTVDEACELVEAGFDYVCEVDGVKLFRKRK